MFQCLKTARRTVRKPHPSTPAHPNLCRSHIGFKFMNPAVCERAFSLLAYACRLCKRGSAYIYVHACLRLYISVQANMYICMYFLAVEGGSVVTNKSAAFQRDLLEPCPSSQVFHPQHFNRLKSQMIRAPMTFVLQHLHTKT